MFKLPPSERLSRWQSFRKKLASLSFNEAVKQTNEFWQSCPFTPYYLDPGDPAQWPDPWQLILENYYCDLAKVLGIVYTLHLSAHARDLVPEIQIYYDYDKKYTYHIAQLGLEKYVINLEQDIIVNKQHINQNLKLKYCYTAADLKLEKY